MKQKNKMGKKKGPAWNFFNIKKDKTVQCKYCNLEYKHANVNKMEKHIKKCFKCPVGLKKILNRHEVDNKLCFKQVPTASKLEFSEHLSIDVDNPDESCQASQMSSTSSNSTTVSATRGSCSPLLLKTARPGTSANSSSEMPCSLSNARISKIHIDGASTLLTAFVDHMDEKSNEMLNQQLAKAIFVSGSPFSLVEHPLWIDFFKKIRPSYCLPSRFRLASTYLDAQYSEMQCEVKRQLSEAKHLHLQCDGWSNIRNESIINFVISKPQPLFVDFVMSKENKHEASYLAQQIERVMKDHGFEKFFVIIGDNAANMRAAFTLIKGKYPNILPLGCLSHLLHLLCTDILQCKSIQTFLSHAVEIVKNIKRSHHLQSMFVRIQNQEIKKNAAAISLKLPVKTRWGSYLYCFQSLKANKFALQTLAVSESQLQFELKKRLLDDEVFWVRVEKMVYILEPIVKLIICLESNCPQIHLVNKEFNNLENILVEQLPMSPLQKTDEKLILDKFKTRKEFGIGPIHLAAEILNPMMQGGDLKPPDLLDGLTFIYEVGQQMQLDSIQLKTDLVHYREKDGLWGRKILWEGLQCMSPLLWWRSLRGTSIIVEVALRILSAPVTSAATERTFSTFSWIHNKKRNRLTSERAAKLTYISYNWKLLHCDENTKCKKRKLELRNDENTSQKNLQSFSSEEDNTETDNLYNSSENSNSGISEPDSD